MKLKHVSIKNFRSVRELNFDFPDSGLLTLLGANNAGKSNIVRAIDALCGDTWFGKDKLERHDHYQRDAERAIEIELMFDSGHAVSWSSTSNNKFPLYKAPDGARMPFGSNVKEDFPCTYLGADRSFDRHMSFYDWTLIGKIRRHFNKRAGPIEAKLKAKYGELVELFDEVEGFQAFADGFSECFNRLQADSPTKLKIDFKPYTPSNYFKNLEILSEDAGQADAILALDELGEGSRNTVLIALLWSYAVNFRAHGEVSGLLALEEPEIFLHPHARRHLFKVLREIAETGYQVIISTHSGSFVDTEYFDNIGKVSKRIDPDDGRMQHTHITRVTKSALVQHCVDTGVPSGKVSPQNITEFYRATANPMLNEAFFARQLVLVEGETEALSLPVFLAHVGLDCDLLGISIIDVKGKNQLPKYWRLFGRFGIPTIMLFDNDNEQGANDQSNAQMANCLGLTTDDLIKNVDIFKSIVGARVIKTPHLVLENDYEHALKKDFRSWCGQRQLESSAYDDWEREAKDLIKPAGKQGKQLIARFIARRLCQEHPTYVPSFVRYLAEQIGKRLGIVPQYPS